jgi:hypothetical protein
MDWLLDLIRDVGSYALGGIVLALVVIVVISMMDRHSGKKPPDPFSPPKESAKSPTREK